MSAQRGPGRSDERPPDHDRGRDPSGDGPHRPRDRREAGGNRRPHPRRDPAPRRAARPSDRGGDRRQRGRRDPGRRAGHHVLPRRPVADRPAARRQGNRPAVRSQRCHRRSRRRCPLHGADDPGRDGRPCRLRSAAGHPSGRPRGSRPSRAADSRRPRRQERADLPRGGRQGPARGDRRRGRRPDRPRDRGRGGAGRMTVADREREDGAATIAVPIVDSPPHEQPVAWRHRHLLDVDVLTWADIELVMRTTDAMREVLARPIAKVPALRGRNVTILFYEASTRTRVSFEVAAKNLSADVVNIAAATSSVSKGESLVDTVRTVEALGAEMLVIRHSVSGAPYLAAETLSGSVLNGGDGWHAHPTQALLDLYTMRSHLPVGSVAGRKVVIVGDVLHSRVARSNIWSLTAAGADLWLCGPATLLRGFDAWASRGAAGGGRFNVTSSLDEALRDADVVMALRIQRERMASGLLPSLREYAARYGLTSARLALARPGALVMHPGPMNEGVEIAPDVAAGAQSVITEQVTNGVAVRMALLYLLAGTHRGEAA